LRPCSSVPVAKKVVWPCKLCKKNNLIWIVFCCACTEISFRLLGAKFDPQGRRTLAPR
jgi:hypothetical protein